MLIYSFENKSIIIEEKPLEIMKSFRQTEKTQNESGGILLGKVYKDKIVIQKVTIPGIKDKSGRYFFERNVEIAQSVVDKEWILSNGERIYLGEWHTHPEEFPTPSPTDTAFIKNMLKDSIMEIDFLLLIIIGINDLYIGIQNDKKLINLSKQ